VIRPLWSSPDQHAVAVDDRPEATRRSARSRFASSGQPDRADSGPAEFGEHARLDLTQQRQLQDPQGRGVGMAGRTLLAERRASVIVRGSFAPPWSARRRPCQALGHAGGGDPGAATPEDRVTTTAVRRDDRRAHALLSQQRADPPYRPRDPAVLQLALAG